MPLVFAAALLACAAAVTACTSEPRPAEADSDASAADAAASDADVAPDADADAEPACPPGAPCLYEGDGPYAFTTHALDPPVTYTDLLGEERVVDVFLRLPVDAPRPLPVALVSHGGSGGRTNADTVLPEWGAHLAARGYATVVIAHAGRSPASYADLCAALGVRDDATFPCAIKIHWDRPHDVGAVLDRLAADAPAGGVAGELDLDRVAHVGHSAGSSAAMMLAGATRDFRCAQPFGRGQGATVPCEEPVSLAEPRVRAVVALSPQGPGTEGFVAESFATVDVPAFLATGADDGDPGVPYNRLAAFDWLPDGPHWRLYLDDVAARHGLFAGTLDACPAAFDVAHCERLRAWLFASVTAFLDGHLRARDDAHAWLASGAVEGLSGGVATLVSRADLVRAVENALATDCPVDPDALRVSTPAGDALRRFTIPAPLAACNDGSPAVAYVRRAATAADAGRWVIFLQGGGGCDSQEACRDRWCGEQGIYDAAKMSTRWAPAAIGDGGIFRRGAGNPFGGANQVYVYYCSSDRWLGRRGRVALTGEGPVDFRIEARGHDIVSGLLDALDRGARSDDGAVNLPPLSDAETVLWTGSSAGSVGATHHLDRVAARYPDARVVGVFDAGFGPLLEDLPEPIEGEALAYLQSIGEGFDALTGAAYDASCVDADADRPWRCADATWIKTHHLTTPFFQRFDLRDAVASRGLEGFGLSREAWTEAARAAALGLGGAEGDDVGVFAPACGQHVALTANPWFGVATVVDGAGVPRTFAESLGRWLGGDPTVIVDTPDGAGSACEPVTEARE